MFKNKRLLKQDLFDILPHSIPQVGDKIISGKNKVYFFNMMENMPLRFGHINFIRRTRLVTFPIQSMNQIGIIGCYPFLQDRQPEKCNPLLARLLGNEYHQ